MSISIHAPHTESDTRRCLGASATDNFNPRSPYGERRSKFHPFTIWLTFQSTLPIRRATEKVLDNPRFTVISIHAPHTESDLHTYSLVFKILISIHAPHTESDSLAKVDGYFFIISIHAPHTESDVNPKEFVAVENISIHAPHTESDLNRMATLAQQRYFNPRSPYGERLWIG